MYYFCPTAKTFWSGEVSKIWSITREPLLKGKAQYSWPPCTNLFRLVSFDIANIILLFHKTSYLNEEVNCIEPSPLVGIPWLSLLLFENNFVSFRNFFSAMMRRKMLITLSVKIWNICGSLKQEQTNLFLSLRVNAINILFLMPGQIS